MSPFIDMSGVNEWESYFRYCCYPEAPLYLEVGVTENGTTAWTVFEAHGDFIQSANSASDNPEGVSVDIMDINGHQRRLA